MSEASTIITVEAARLQRTFDGLNRLLELPATWSDTEPTQILQSSVEALLDLLSLDLVYVVLNADGERSATEISSSALVERSEIGVLLRAALGSDANGWPSHTKQIVAGRELSLITRPLGSLGVFVAGAASADLSESTYGVLLSVAANQAAVALQSAQLRELGSRAAIDGIPGFVATLTPAGAVEYVNRPIQEYTGQPLAGLMEWGTNGIVHPEDMPHVAEIFGQSIAAGTPYEIEQRLRRFDGVYRWFGNRGIPERDATGGIARWYVLLTDIEDRWQAKQALHERELELRRIFDNLPVLLSLLSPGARVELINRQILEYTGLPFAELENWKMSDLVHADDFAHARASAEKGYTGSAPFEIVYRMRRHDGVYRWFEARHCPMRDADGRVYQWCVAVIDIHDRKHAEDAVAANERKLQLIIDTIPALAWAAHPDGSAEFFNQHYQEYVGRSAEQLQGSGWAEAVHPDDRAGLFAAWQSMKVAGRGGVIEARVRRHDGQYRWLLLRTNPLCDETGAIAKWFGVNVDIDDLKSAEGRLETMRAELAQVTRTMSLGVLTASIAHEVTQPLAGILTNADACMRMLSADPPNVSGALATTRRTIRDAHRATEVIQRLRALFRRKDVVLEPLDLNEAAREVIALVWQDLQRRRISLQTELDQKLPAISGDRVQLQQVILNLLSNAADALRTVDDRPRSILISTRHQPDGTAHLTVRDNGVGLSLDTPSKLFDAFYTTKPEGMGIGLSVSRSIVESHQGRVWCAPNNGPGATFAFAIPVGPALTEPAFLTHG
jgi:PAS domain S-box-containing protein